MVGDQQHQTIGWLPECVCPRTVLARLCAKAEVKGRPADLAEISPPREETAPVRGTRRPEVSGRNPVNCAAETFPRGQDKSVSDNHSIYTCFISFGGWMILLRHESELESSSKAVNDFFSQVNPIQARANTTILHTCRLVRPHFASQYKTCKIVTAGLVVSHSTVFCFSVHF